ncbi:hypothetical protein BGZ67_000658 [Mortierella alpina]|nr:hypothetical protein BGZ67_000658 [Mortierella alpina]
MQELSTGNPQTNVDEAVTTFVHEFETRRALQPEDRSSPLSSLQETPLQLSIAKEALESGLGNTSAKARTTSEKLQALQRDLAEDSQARVEAANPTRQAKEAFQKDIDEAREAFDQEMALRHADVVKQYVGAFVQQIDHY